jgi:predicted ATPase
VAGKGRFFGRESEVDHLTDLVAAARLVTITGPGGVGKTRLVTEALPALGQTVGAEPCLVALADVAAGATAETISGEVGMASPEAVALSFGGEPALLVLDNGEHLLDGAADFTARLLDAAEQAAVVVTSRAPLALAGEHIMVLEPLAPPGAGDTDPEASPAVELFFERAAAGGSKWLRTDDAVAAVAELCRLVDGLPLAIELAATRARALSPTELLTLVTERVDALRSTERDRPERHRSVRAAFDVSVELLDEESRVLLWRLGVFDGPFDLALVHAVAGPDPADRLRTIDLLGGLVDRSLVMAEATASTTRYRLLALVHELTGEALHTEGLWEDTTERFVAAMAVEADEMILGGATRWSADLLAHVVARVGHLIVAIDRSIERDDDPARAFRMYVPLLAATHQSRSPEVRAVGARLFTRWPDTAAPWRAEALAILATAQAIATNLDEAEAAAEQSLADPAATALGQALAERALTLAGIGRHDHPAALAHAQQGRAYAAGKVPPLERELTGFEASLLDRVGESEAASALAMEVAETSVQDQDPITEIWGRLVAATIAIRAQRWDLADEQIALAQAVSRAIDDGWWGGTIFRSVALLTAYEASARAEIDGWEASRALWLQAVERAADRGDLSELTLTLKAAAVVASRAGHQALAVDLISTAPRIFELTVLPDVFPEDRLALEALVADEPTTERPALVTAVRAALSALSQPVGSPSAGQDRRAGAAPPATATRAGPAPAAEGQFRHEGDVWALTYGGSTVRVRDLKGIGDLAVLLSRPGEEVHCLELMGANDVGGAPGPGLDEEARRQYQRRILELQGDIDDAKAANDPARAEKAEVELDALIAQLSEAFGLGGRARGKGSSAERARTAVTYRVRAAIKRVAEQHPDLAHHLQHAVRTGTWCSYQPEHPVAWTVDRAPGPDG